MKAISSGGSGAPSGTPEHADIHRIGGAAPIPAASTAS